MSDPSRTPSEGLAPRTLAPDVVEDLSDMLTVIMGNLDLLAHQPLPPHAARQVARADLAVHRAGWFLWTSMDPAPTSVVAVPP